MKLTSGSVNGASLVCDAKIFRWVTTLGDVGESPPDQLLSTKFGHDRKKLIFLPSYFVYTIFRG
jgi:hypothetical protein